MTSSAAAAPSPLPPYERIEGLHVLRLAGTDYEMGFQHGQLLRDAIPRGPLPYFAEYVRRLLAVGLTGGVAASASRVLSAALPHTVGRRIAAAFPPHVRQALDGLADGAGIPRGELLRAVTMPETYLWVATWFKKLHPSPAAPRLGVPVMGCTSALAWGGATGHGRLLHGRNFDYQGVGAWDREQAVVFHDPADGQPYVSISAAGVLLGGVTAMNASGLTLAVHQHIASEDFDLGGLPVGVVGDAIMRHGRDLGDARRLLDAHRPGGAWTYVVGSARESRVLVYEVSARRRAAFHPAEDVFGYANVFLDRAFEGSEKHFYPTYWRNNTARYARANARLRAARGGIDADEIASILGDPGDPSCRVSGSIAMLSTVASVVFDPGAGLFHVATGRPPVSNRPYLAFDLGGRRPLPDLPRLLGGTRHDPSAIAAFDAFRDAFEAHFNAGDAAAARGAMGRARALAPSQPVYAFVAGLLALEAGDAEGARALFDDAVRLGHPEPARRASFHLWRGRAADALGRRDEALRDYARAADGDARVRTAAERGRKKPWRRRGFGIEWNFGDVMSP
ncbi:C45 family autoproteolytic acyltransferase/hydrolase [Myxococcota bacterium]|nr:C45 family autoproteolytic acyltransferase/hydrolase [Myxococcota bacterium]